MKLFEATAGHVTNFIMLTFTVCFFVVYFVQIAHAEEFKISSVVVEGNRRIETATIK